MTDRIVHSPFSDLEVPEYPVHVAWFSHFDQHGDKVAMIDVATDRHVTYRELLNSSRLVGSGLSKLGIRKGDLVALFSENSAEMAIMFYAILYSGAAVTTLNHTYTKYEVATQLKDCGAKYIYTSVKLLQTCKDAITAMDNLAIICNAPDQNGIVQFSSLESDTGSEQDKLDRQTFEVRDDVAIVPYSSGTTGLPKGVMLTHFNLMANLSQFGHSDLSSNPSENPTEDPQKDTEERYMLVIPLYHVYGILMNLAVTAGGHTLVLLDKFQPETFLGAIQKYKVTNLPLVPALVHFLAKSPLVEQYDVSSVIEAVCGAAPFPVNTVISL